MKTIDELYREYQPILSKEECRDHRYWVFPIDSPSPFLSGNRDFSCGDTNISIIDHYHGRCPYLMNHDYACGHRVHLQFVPTVILDSHIVSYLRDYANGNEKMPRSRKRAVLQLLEYLTLNRYDYNPFYYWLEAGKISGSETHVQQATEAIFKLHNMDKDHFLRTGEIRTDFRKVEEYLDAYGATSLAHVAVGATADIPDSELQIYMKNQAAISYTTILRMVLIEATHPKYSLIEKI